MIRKSIGIALIVLMVALKVLLNHNIEYWATVKSLGLWIGFIGFVVLFFNVFEKIDTMKPRSFRMYPVQYLLYLIYFGVFLTANVYAIIKLEDLAEWGNNKLKEYYLAEDTEEADAVVMGDTDIYYTIKYNKHTERFTIIEYNVDDETITQAGKADGRIVAGDRIRLIYSKRHPTFFEIR
ncbi:MULTISPECIES: hypothetical protein [Sphingobacterium]|uniref:hypothetical protein n=1 Tax=Sphingobacterium TaxID=28453 RepID=UPI0013D9F4F1|nr:MULTISPECIES: hypothetical protein [unclassified Sphingobacterium]